MTIVTRLRACDNCGAPLEDPDEILCPECRLRAIWNAKGIPKEQQDAILADIEAKARPGAKIGPFTIPG
ncbi:MAG: hypothetical protein HY869_20885 [Chloroflexi bacterium]|nr:hypothetical protein [Chloroflexota bacterium]